MYGSPEPSTLYFLSTTTKVLQEILIYTKRGHTNENQGDHHQGPLCGKRIRPAGEMDRELGLWTYATKEKRRIFRPESQIVSNESRKLNP